MDSEARVRIGALYLQGPTIGDAAVAVAEYRKLQL